MAYKIGTRVKKVRGYGNVGLTGVVCVGPTVNGMTLDMSVENANMYIRMDSEWINQYGSKFPALTVGMSNSSNWEPIIPDGAAPSELSYQELLESLEEKGVVA